MKHFIRLPRRILILAATVILGLVFVGIALATDGVPIDHFDGAEVVMTAKPNLTVISYTTSLTNMLGTERDIEVINLGHLKGGDATVKVDYEGSSQLSFNQDNNTTSKVIVQWDGVDGSMTIAPTGLYSGGVGVDLTAGNIYTNIVMRITGNDNPVGVVLKFWSDATHCSQKSFTTPGGNITNGSVDMVFPMTSFTTACTGGYSNITAWTSIGAVEMDLDGSVSVAADLSMEFLESADQVYDYGDLPETNSSAPSFQNYAGLVMTTTSTSNPGRHLLGTALRFGDSVDAEDNGQQSIGANGDDLNAVDDEDGIVKGGTWSQGTAGGSLDITVNGRKDVPTGHYACNSSDTYGKCYIEGWIDWNNDGQFVGANEHIIDGSVAWTSTCSGCGRIDSLGTNTYLFDIPVTASLATTATYYARFRLCGGIDAGAAVDDCSTPGGTSVVGEVEDYLVTFFPLSVNLASFTAAKAGDHNVLSWETNSELHNLGFNVWRGTSDSAPDVKLNQYVIPSQAPGGTGGFTYSYTDSGIASGTDYYYWLEDVDLNGKVTRHGPVLAGGSKPTAVTLAALQGGSSAPVLPLVALSFALVAGVGLVVVRRRK